MLDPSAQRFAPCVIRARAGSEEMTVEGVTR
jgi:hypothetical protein